MSGLTRTHVLIAENYGGGMKMDLSDGTSIYQPPNRVDWASMYDELFWTISLTGAPSGTPTTWALTAKFQYRQMHANSTFRHQVPRWYDLSDEQIASHVVEGVGWYGPGQSDPGGAAGTIATQATDLSSPLVVARALRHFPQGVRLVLGITVSGGSTPKIPLGVEVIGKDMR